ncbi:DUF4833 domain-containing protein [Shimia biformata]|uniref:DUF4833 domain-containing protein n=1 Tax=Shimia biformata TaxID=1294299 RepID=UPI00194FA608|nr:DUF4833 domain-containing protein [Shimia biformata]
MLTRRSVIGLFTALGAITMFPGTALAVPKLSLVSAGESNGLPIARPEFARPTDKNQVFFIQRSMNANTVVYAARFDKAGRLDRKSPLHGYWRRYNTGGATRALSFSERNFAYGTKAKATKNDGIFRIRFAALPGFETELRQAAPGQADLWFDFNGKNVQLVYAYLDLDDRGLIPSVVSIRLFGRIPATGRHMTLNYSVSGGAINE